MNQHEFLKLIAPFKDKVFRMSKRLLVSVEEAEDATQEVLLKLWRRNESLGDYSSVEALAMTMTRNHCLDQLKSKRSSNVQMTQNHFADRQPSVQQQFEDADSLSWVERIINSLPEQQRLIVHMRDIEQYEFAAIAQVLDMNETAVRVALSRARKTIREQIIKVHEYGIKQN